MGKDKSEKKEKKEKRSEKDGVKKSKKDKKSKLSDENLAAAFEEATKEVEQPVVETKALLVKESSGEAVVKPVGALVPFANPLADEKVSKKVLKSVKKGRFYTSIEVWFGDETLIEWNCSGQEQDAQARSQGSCQGTAKITTRGRKSCSTRRRYPRSRYLAHGCHFPYPRPVRRP
jgi:H/ACA ribonucleoprotein complex subunit 2